MSDWARHALADAAPVVLWLDDDAAPAPLAPLAAATSADLAVVGGGFTGLWTALLAKSRDPDRDVLVLDAGRCGDQASGRNGGFASASLTHGFANGMSRWAEDMPVLDRLGRENLAAIADTVREHRIDCHWEPTGELTVATAAHEVDELAELAGQLRAAGHDARLLDADAVRREVDSPTYLAGLWEPDATALVEPGRLVWGLRRLCLDLGVRIHEHTRATELSAHPRTMRLGTSGGEVVAARVVLATNAFPSLLRRLRLRTVPVYDYVLATEPLTRAQMESVGWARRQGVGDASNAFHYYRLTRDNRIVWGGYDAAYHYGSRIRPDLEQSGGTHQRLAQHFFSTFPQLEGVRFTHRWAGVIDTCTRFAAFYGTAHHGRVAYALGYTGLGVAASRFGAQVALDLLDGAVDEAAIERTTLRMVRERPLPFPPEPLRYAAVELTRRSLIHADAHRGRRNLWLRTLDRFGLGFDS